MHATPATEKAITDKTLAESECYTESRVERNKQLRAQCHLSVYASRPFDRM